MEYSCENEEYANYLLNEEVVQLRQEKTKWIEAYNNLQQAFDSEKRAHDATKNNLREKNKLITSLADNVSKLKQKFRIKRMRTLAKSLDQIYVNCSECETSLGNVLLQLQHISQDVMNTRDENTNLKEQIENMTNKEVNLNFVNQQLNHKIETLTSELNSLKVANRQLKTKKKKEFIPQLLPPTPDSESNCSSVIGQSAENSLGQENLLEVAGVPLSPNYSAASPTANHKFKMLTQQKQTIIENEETNTRSKRSKKKQKLKTKEVNIKCVRRVNPSNNENQGKTPNGNTKTQNVELELENYCCSSPNDVSTHNNRTTSAVHNGSSLSKTVFNKTESEEIYDTMKTSPHCKTADNVINGHSVLLQNRSPKSSSIFSPPLTQIDKGLPIILSDNDSDNSQSNNIIFETKTVAHLKVSGSVDFETKSNLNLASNENQVRTLKPNTDTKNFKLALEKYRFRSSNAVSAHKNTTVSVVHKGSNLSKTTSSKTESEEIYDTIKNDINCKTTENVIGGHHVLLQNNSPDSSLIFHPPFIRNCMGLPTILSDIDSNKSPQVNNNFETKTVAEDIQTKSIFSPPNDASLNHSVLLNILLDIDSNSDNTETEKPYFEVKSPSVKSMENGNYSKMTYGNMTSTNNSISSPYLESNGGGELISSLPMEQDLEGIFKYFSLPDLVSPIDQHSPICNEDSSFDYDCQFSGQHSSLSDEFQDSGNLVEENTVQEVARTTSTNVSCCIEGDFINEQAKVQITETESRSTTTRSGVSQDKNEQQILSPNCSLNDIKEILEDNLGNSKFDALYQTNIIPDVNDPISEYSMPMHSNSSILNLEPTTKLSVDCEMTESGDDPLKLHVKDQSNAMDILEESITEPHHRSQENSQDKCLSNIKSKDLNTSFSSFDNSLIKVCDTHLKNSDIKYDCCKEEGNIFTIKHTTETSLHHTPPTDIYEEYKSKTSLIHTNNCTSKLTKMKYSSFKNCVNISDSLEEHSMYGSLNKIVLEETVLEEINSDPNKIVSTDNEIILPKRRKKETSVSQSLERQQVHVPKMPTPKLQMPAAETPHKMATVASQGAPEVLKNYSLKKHRISRCIGAQRLIPLKTPKKKVNVSNNDKQFDDCNGNRLLIKNTSQTSEKLCVNGSTANKDSEQNLETNSSQSEDTNHMVIKAVPSIQTQFSLIPTVSSVNQIETNQDSSVVYGDHSYIKSEDYTSTSAKEINLINKFSNYTQNSCKVPKIKNESPSHNLNLSESYCKFIDLDGLDSNIDYSTSNVDSIFNGVDELYFGIINYQSTSFLRCNKTTNTTKREEYIMVNNKTQQQQNIQSELSINDYKSTENKEFGVEVEKVNSQSPEKMSTVSVVNPFITEMIKSTEDLALLISESHVKNKNFTRTKQDIFGLTEGEQNKEILKENITLIKNPINQNSDIQEPQDVCKNKSYSCLKTSVINGDKLNESKHGLKLRRNVNYKHYARFSKDNLPKPYCRLKHEKKKLMSAENLSFHSTLKKCLSFKDSPKTDKLNEKEPLNSDKYDMFPTSSDIELKINVNSTPVCSLQNVETKSTILNIKYFKDILKESLDCKNTGNPAMTMRSKNEQNVSEMSPLLNKTKIKAKSKEKKISSDSTYCSPLKLSLRNAAKEITPVNKVPCHSIRKKGNSLAPSEKKPNGVVKSNNLSSTNKKNVKDQELLEKSSSHSEQVYKSMAQLLTTMDTQDSLKDQSILEGKDELLMDNEDDQEFFNLPSKISTGLNSSPLNKSMNKKTPDNFVPSFSILVPPEVCKYTESLVKTNVDFSFPENCIPPFFNSEQTKETYNKVPDLKFTESMSREVHLKHETTQIELDKPNLKASNQNLTTREKQTSGKQICNRQRCNNTGAPNTSIGKTLNNTSPGGLAEDDSCSEDDDDTLVMDVKDDEQLLDDCSKIDPRVNYFPIDFNVSEKRNNSFDCPFPKVARSEISKYCDPLVKANVDIIPDNRIPPPYYTSRENKDTLYNTGHELKNPETAKHEEYLKFCIEVSEQTNLENTNQQNEKPVSCLIFNHEEPVSSVISNYKICNNQKALNDLIPKGSKIPMTGNILQTSTSHLAKNRQAYICKNVTERCGNNKPKVSDECAEQVAEILGPSILDVVDNLVELSKMADRLVVYDAATLLRALNLVLNKVANKAHVKRQCNREVKRQCNKEVKWIESLEDFQWEPNQLVKVHPRIQVFITLFFLINDKKHHCLPKQSPFFKEALEFITDVILTNKIENYSPGKMAFLVYTYTCLARLSGQLLAAQHLLYQALYCLAKSSLSVAYIMLHSWPAILRVQPIEAYKDDPLALTIIHALTTGASLETKGKNSLNFMYMNRLQQMMRFKYNFVADTVPSDHLVDNFLHRLSQQNVEEAFILLAKRRGEQWFLKRPLAQLIEVVNSWRSGARDGREAASAINIVCSITRSFNRVTSKHAVRQLFVLLRDLLTNQRTPAWMQEVVAVNLCRLSRLDFLTCTDILANWKPTEVSSQVIDHILTNIIGRRSCKWWQDKKGGLFYFAKK